MSILQPDNYPTDAFPPIIRNAIYEAHQQVLAPIPLIGASVLAALSLSFQGAIDVSWLGRFRSPVSLSLITLGESGERKTTVDKLIMAPLNSLDRYFSHKYAKQMSEYEMVLEIFNIEKGALHSQLRRQTQQNKDTSDIRVSLSELMSRRPIPPVRKQMIFSDITPAKFKYNLSSDRSCMGLISDEADVVFSGYAMRELSLLNKVWDGASFTVERRNSPSLQINNARLTISLMVQPERFSHYMKRYGEATRGSGFLARSMICYPTSTQGDRLLKGPVISSEHIPVFHNRLRYLLKKYIVHSNKVICLRFSPEAETAWIEYFNYVESKIKPHHAIFNIKDSASKMMENVARTAALLHFFEYEGTEIGADTIHSAMKINRWYINQHIDLFVPSDPVSVMQSDSEELFEWVKAHCGKNHTPFIRKNIILQYGPNRFRKRILLDELLMILLTNGKVMINKSGNSTYITPNWNV